MGFGRSNPDFDRFGMKHNLDYMVMKTKLESRGKKQDMPYKSDSLSDGLRQLGRALGGITGAAGGKRKGSWADVQSMLESMDDESGEQEEAVMQDIDAEPEKKKQSEKNKKENKKKNKKKNRKKEDRTGDAPVQTAAAQAALPGRAEREYGQAGPDAVRTPGACSAEQLRQAVVWAEILGEPTAKKRRRARERQRYGNQGNAYRG